MRAEPNEFPMGEVHRHIDGLITVLGVSDNKNYVMCVSQARGWEMWSVEAMRRMEVVS
jgi:hypothetical protein